MSKKNKPLPAIADAMNADLIPIVQKWLKDEYPEANFTFSNLSTLMCYATSPEEFNLPSVTDAIKAFNGDGIETVEDCYKLLADRGLALVHTLMTRYPKATVATLAKFQHEDAKLMKKKIWNALRRNNLEGMSGNELVEYLIDVGEIDPKDATNARRRLQEMRNKDLENLDSKDEAFFSSKHKAVRKKSF